MQVIKRNIIGELQNEILLLQGYKSHSNRTVEEVGLDTIKNNFPNHRFPTTAIHEFLCMDSEATAATTGFITALLSSLMSNNGITIWIQANKKVFAPGLKLFGINPDQIIFIELNNEKEILWTMEEALKCSGLAAVVGEINAIDFTASRRFQLAIEKTGVTGFVIRQQKNNCNVIASTFRWQITHLSSELDDNLPGVGFPRWNVQLLKARNGSPGEWQLEWSEKKFRHILSPAIFIAQGEKRKTG